MSMTKSFGYSLAIYCAQVPGYFSAAWFNEKIGRQATIASYMLLAARARWGWRWPRRTARSCWPASSCHSS